MGTVSPSINCLTRDHDELMDRGRRFIDTIGE